MRICLVNEFPPSGKGGGIVAFFQLLIDYLISRGFEASVITNRFGKEKGYEEIEGVSIYRIDSSPFRIGHIRQIPGITLPFNFFNFPLKKKLRKIIKDCDCIYVNNLYHLSFAPIQVAKEEKKSILIDVHDYWPMCMKKDLLFLGKKFCSETNPYKCLECLSSIQNISKVAYSSLAPLLLLEYSLRKKFLTFDEIIAHSKFVKKIIKKQLNANARLIPYPYLGNIVFKKRGSIGNTLNLLYMGRIEYTKGVHILLEICSLLKKENIPYVMNVMGYGSMLEKIKNESEKRELNINFYGHVGYMSLNFIQILKSSDILLVPSIWYEPFGMVVLEAMAFGIPIIGSDRGGLKEVIQENDVGIVAPPIPEIFVEKIKQVVEDKKLFRKMSRNGVKNIKKYDLKKVLKSYERIIEKLA